MKILYMTGSWAYFTNNVRDFDQSFSRFSRHEIYYFDISKPPFDIADIDLSQFDAILFSYTFLGLTETFSKEFKERMRAFSGLKIPLLQDEYLYFLRHRENLASFGIDGIVTAVPPQGWNTVFADVFAGLPKLHALTGYIDDSLASRFSSRRPLQDRKWQIGYRGRIMRPIFGKLAHEKYEIGLAMKRLCLERGVAADIEVEENKRIYASAWPEFIRNCQVMLGTESGSNVFDFTGEISRCIEKYQQRHPDADFWEIHAACIGDEDGIVQTNQISPRIFESICLGTGHILFEGEYSGIIQPWRHYIPLKKDYSNLDEALDALRDLQFVENMIERSYQDVVAGGQYSYQAFVRQVDDFVDSFGARHESAQLVSDPHLTTHAPDRLCELDLPALRREEEKHIKETAAQYAGKKLLAYGAGTAFETYAPYFSQSSIMGIILDDKFLADKPKKYGSIPYLKFSEARSRLQEADGCIIFCRPEYRFTMGQNLESLLQTSILSVEVCIFYQ